MPRISKASIIVVTHERPPRRSAATHHRRLSDSADLGRSCYEYDANSSRVKLSFAGDAVPPFVSA